MIEELRIEKKRDWHFIFQSGRKKLERDGYVRPQRDIEDLEEYGELGAMSLISPCQRMEITS